MDAVEFRGLIHSKLSITTYTGNYEGILKFVSTSGQRLIFEHVYELPAHEYLGTMHVLSSSIMSWKLLRRVEENFDVSNFNTLDEMKSLVNGEFSKKERLDVSDFIDVDPDKHFVEYLPLNLKNKCPGDFRIIDSMNSDFCKAVKALSESDIIGASFHGPEISRSGTLTWMCLSTSSCVFLIDIQHLGDVVFKEGLKEIFENKKIVKVVHDCRKVAELLHYVFNTELTSVFDTQVADYMINMQMCAGEKMFEYVNSLDSCLFKYLKVPQQFLYNRNKSASIVDEIDFYKKRPIGKDFTNFLIKSSIYLSFLKEVQEKLLMSPYEHMVELSLNNVRSMSDRQVKDMMKLKSNSNDDSTPPSYLLESLKAINFLDDSLFSHAN